MGVLQTVFRVPDVGTCTIQYSRSLSAFSFFPLQFAGTKPVNPKLNVPMLFLGKLLELCKQCCLEREREVFVDY